MEYEYLARIYDHLMEEVDYEAWVDYIEHFIEKNNPTKNNQILELACGTGNITVPLKQKGYKITAIDRSLEMLSQAQQKAADLGLNIDFYQQDMLNLDIQERYNTILCLCDGVNYILDLKDLQSFFRKVFDLLREDGIFIFDISTYYKLKNILGGNTYGEDLVDLTYLWENYFCEADETVEMDLTFFQLDQVGLYKKHKEFHVQKAYRQHTVVSLLKEVGFIALESYHELSFDKPKEDSHRIFFICRKPGRTR